MERTFMIVDRWSEQPLGICSGPTHSGQCPHAKDGQIPCAGRKVIPLSGTAAHGLPFTIMTGPTSECPVAWLCEPLEAIET
jgi:hypothetical protein